ncbi:hypothetical protein HYPSUDRAFT_200179 [Hypholoma sublateritium FD-334 SS-4]|uniref:Uncharacterized protein n=1 Tax=Hypholoma sublateritium (strain FD-334 SS-4) TaxID=945553 RepID=A0A0D2P8D9_HYPSF|nr:hypothetical protein HYPSUDRAFT_200179 [Hypholoma sublateritium FD-334 SS-4]
MGHHHTQIRRGVPSPTKRGHSLPYAGRRLTTGQSAPWRRPGRVFQGASAHPAYRKPRPRSTAEEKIGSGDDALEELIDWLSVCMRTWAARTRVRAVPPSVHVRARWAALRVRALYEEPSREDVCRLREDRTVGARQRSINQQNPAHLKCPKKRKNRIITPIHISSSRPAPPSPIGVENQGQWGTTATTMRHPYPSRRSQPHKTRALLAVRGAPDDQKTRRRPGRVFCGVNPSSAYRKRSSFKNPLLRAVHDPPRRACLHIASGLGAPSSSAAVAGYPDLSRGFPAPQNEGTPLPYVESLTTRKHRGAGLDASPNLCSANPNSNPAYRKPSSLNLPLRAAHVALNKPANGGVLGEMGTAKDAGVPFF